MSTSTSDKNERQNRELQNDVKGTQLRFYCDQCEKSYSISSSLSRHKLTHNDVRPFQCDQCKASFVRPYLLKRHKLTHAGKRRVKCDRCEKTVCRCEYLQEHTVRDISVKLNKCELCGKSFAQRRYLLQHIKIHKWDQPLKHAKNRGDHLMKREEYQAVQTLKCTKNHGDHPMKREEYQDDQLLESEKYQGDQIRRTQAKIKKLFKCELCKRTFDTESNLLRHVKTHISEKSLECDKCEKSFSNVEKLMQHMEKHTDTDLNIHKFFYGQETDCRYHTGEKLFDCILCLKKYLLI